MMLRKVKRKLRHILGIKNDTDYYSQAGEDAIISKTFSFVIPVKNGTYVDIGSFHPFHHSNTYILYKAGWRGINVDPRPGSKKLFDQFRKGDVNIEAGVAGTNGMMQYYMLGEDSTMNTFSRENLEGMGLFDKVKKVIDIPVYKFDDLINKYSSGITIDYLNIDAEGFEMEILSGLDFTKTPPTVISIEQNNVLTLQDVLKTEVNEFLNKKGYSAYAKNVLLSSVSTVFYIKDSKA